MSMHIVLGHQPPIHVPLNTYPRHIPSWTLTPQTYTRLDTYPLDRYPLGHIPPGHIPPEQYYRFCHQSFLYS